jgi:osmotically-inducible protein OsmY
VDAKLTRASLASTTDVKMEVGGKEVDLTGALTDEELASLIEKALGDGPESEPE